MSCACRPRGTGAVRTTGLAMPAPVLARDVVPYFSIRRDDDVEGIASGSHDAVHPRVGAIVAPLDCGPLEVPRQAEAVRHVPDRAQ